MKTQEFIPYEQALALKELGFDERCFGYWNIDPQLKTPAFNMVKPFEHEWCLPAPLYQQAFRWFREKYGLYFSIQYFLYDKWCLQITERKENTVFNNKSIDGFNTYEEAELACLDKLIDLVKNKTL